MRNPYLKSVLTGVLLVIGWPPVSFTPLLFVAFVPLLLVLFNEKSLKKSFYYLFTAFFIWTLGTMYWIALVGTDGWNRFALSFAFILIPLLMTLPAVVFIWSTRMIKARYKWLLLPFFWLCYEYLLSNWDLAFAWLHLGLGLSPLPSFIQFYEFTGASGGSFLIILVNVLLTLIVTNRKRKSLARKLIIGLGAIVLIIGTINTILLNTNRVDGKKVKIAVLQPNIDPYEKLDSKSLYNQVQKLKRMILPFKNKNIDLAVCPEGYLKSREEAPIVLNNIDENPAIKAIKELSLEIDAPVLTGFIGVELQEAGEELPAAAKQRADGKYYVLYNGAMLISHEQPVQYSVKNKLVPFMEKAPFIEYLPFFEKLHLKLNQMKTSYSQTGIATVLHDKKLKIAPLICMEESFHGYARKFSEKEAGVLAVISNDGWAGNTSGYLQNAAYATALAITLRKAVARSANTGASLFVDAYGYISNETAWGEEKVIIKDVSYSNRRTFYTEYGDILSVISLIVMFVVICIRVRSGYFLNNPPSCCF